MTTRAGEGSCRDQFVHMMKILTLCLCQYIYLYFFMRFVISYFDFGQSPHTVKWLFYDGLARLLPQRFHTSSGPISQQILECYCKRVIQSLLPTFPNIYHV